VQDLTTRVRDLEKQLKLAQARVTAAESSTVTGAGVGGDRLNKPAPLPAKKVAKKAPPNQMPAAATAPAKASPAPAAPVAPAKKVAKKVAKAGPATPTGTGDSPVASVKDAAAATELPPVKKTTPRKAAKQAAPATKSPATKSPAKKVPAKKTQPEAGK
jgi:hypothetical protein